MCASSIIASMQPFAPKVRLPALLCPETRERMIATLAPCESMSGFVERAILAEVRRRERTGPRPVRLVLSPPRGRRPARAA